MISNKKKKMLHGHTLFSTIMMMDLFRNELRSFIFKNIFFTVINHADFTFALTCYICMFIYHSFMIILKEIVNIKIIEVDSSQSIDSKLYKF